MLTVVFSTYNGASTLKRTLESFAQADEPDGGWKLIVVDNGSTDNATEILRSFASRLPMNILTQPKRGKNRALNVALPDTEGDLIIFTDDDVIAETDWLVQLRRAADTHPGFDIFGGHITPVWPYEPPDWLLHGVPLSVAYADTEAGKQSEGPIRPGMIWGPNMAIRSCVFEQGHRFDETLGPQAGQYRMGGETEMNRRLEKLGHKAWYCSGARVGHIVRPHQMEPRWLVGRAFRFGRGLFWVHTEQPAAQAAQIFGVPRWVLRHMINSIAKSITAKTRGDLTSWIAARWEFGRCRGYVTEAFSKEGRRVIAARKNIEGG